MLNVAVIGAAGRMGRRLVANIAERENMKLAAAIEYSQSPFLGQDAGVVAGIQPLNVAITADFAAAARECKIDAIINFATSGVLETAKICAASNIAMVIGATALPPEEKAELQELGRKGAKIVLSGNMSVGVNLLFKLAYEAAKILNEQYDVEIIEMHHNQKIDAPSGTALRLGEVICEARDWAYDEVVRHGREGKTGKRPAVEIGMHSLRGGDVVGDHTVVFATGGERVELTHKASSRDTFVKGALRAVEFLADAAPGMYDMQDVLNLK